MGYWTNVLCAVLGLIYGALAGGGGAFIAASTNVKPPITFDGGNVGVNFGGYSASAGLGGLLTGEATKGGLHAEAGTPYGQSAGAGLGGVVAEGGAEGGLYAGADSGVGASAAAGLAGSKSASASFGGGVAAATTGESYVSKVVEKHASPVVVEKTIETAPIVQKTYVERTIIPNYVEKTIQVPSYVEKTVRVPTVVEKKVRVAAPPTVIEKTVDIPQTPVVRAEVETGFQGETGGVVKVVHKTRPVYHKHWVGGFGYRRPFLGGLFARGGFGAGAQGGLEAGSVGAGTGVGGGSAVYSYKQTPNPQVINDIFNIPISTLGAVNKLVSGIVGGAGGSVAVSKHFSAY